MERSLRVPPGTFAWRGPFDPAADPLWRAMQAGELGERDYWAARAAEVAAVSGTDGVPAMMARLFDGPEAELVRPQARDLVAAARRRGLETAVLTNDLYDFHDQAWIDRIRVLAEVGCVVDASRHGTRKPEPAAYRLVLDRLGVAPDQAVFVDDQPANAAGAAARRHGGRLVRRHPARRQLPEGPPRPRPGVRRRRDPMSALVDIPHLIDGEERPAADGRTFESVNPATEAAWARVARGSAEDAAAAVAAARRAFDAGPWPRMAPAERGAALHRLADLIEAQAGSLGRLDSTDMGKPIRQARDNDAHRAALNFRFFADYAALATDEALPSPTGHHVYTRHEPVGVAAAISPWNFPLMLASWKVAPALAFGNTVVLKPAEQSPASCHRLGLLAGQAGLPPGTLNVVQGFGPGEAGQALTEDPGVDLITFTGESATGRAILAAGAPTLKRVSFELGGKGANLVFADADLANAVEWSLRAVFLNAGQVCLSGSRLYVQRPVYDEFLERFVAGAEAMRLGDPLDEATEVGPLASHEHWRKVTGYLDLAAAEGAKVRTGGRGDGWWVRPTVLVDVRQDMAVCREEIFGPVVVVQPFDTDEEAVALANDSAYGLNAMVFTESLRRAHQVAAEVRAGTIWVNCFFVRDLRAPFGGYKDSGIGREGGGYSREFFTEAKAVVMQL